MILRRLVGGSEDSGNEYWVATDGRQQKDSGINRKATFGGGQNLVSNAQLQDPLLLTGTRDLYNYVNVVPGRLCLKDTEDAVHGL
jgi:hypothetical protein